MHILYGILLSAISLVEISLYLFYCKRNFREIYISRRFDKTLFKKMFGFSGWNLFGSFSNVMENQGTNLVLNWFFGPVVNAARGVAMQVNGGVQSFVETITIPVRPQVIQSFASGNLQRTLSLTYSVSKISSIIILILAIPISLEIDYILGLWLGADFPEHTAAFTILILACSFFNTLQSSLSGVVHATGKMKKYQLSCSFIRLMSLPVSIILIHYIHMPEVCLISVAFFSSVVFVNSLFIVRQLVGLSIKRYLYQVLFPVLFVLISSVVVLYPLHSFFTEGFTRLFIVTLSSIILTGSLSYFFVFSEGERILVRQFVDRIKNR